MKHIWDILTTGEPWHDEIVLQKEEAARVATFLLNPEGGGDVRQTIK